MQDIFGSVRRSLVFRPSPENEEHSLGGTLVDKISYCIRSSRVFSKPSPSPPPLPPIPKEDAAPTIRWRKGELIGCGAFGQVYVGMNLDSGELLAVKQVNSYLHSSFAFRFVANFRFWIFACVLLILEWNFFFFLGVCVCVWFLALCISFFRLNLGELTLF